MSDYLLPGPRVRATVSVLVLLHFAAIVIAVTGASSGRFAAPPLMAKSREWCEPYLQPLFLGNPYRFFAPNPGVDPVLWVRVKFVSGQTRTLEWPHFRDRTTSVAFTRDFTIPRGVTRLESPTAKEPGKLSPEGEALVGAVARRFANDVIPETFSVTKDAVESIDFYSIERKLPMPSQVRAAAELPDLGLYEVLHLGKFGPDGRQLGPSAIQLIQFDTLLATVIDRDIKPVATSPEVAAESSKYRQRWPTLVDVLLTQKPALVHMPRAELLAEMKTLLPSSGTAAIHPAPLQP